MKIVAVIPARLASSRFPRKPLAKILGRPMIEHVYERTRRSQLIDEVYVATCDQEIADAVQEFGGKTILTSLHHTRGTDRVAEAANYIPADIVVNVQGDEPMVCPKDLDDAVSILLQNPHIDILNMICAIGEQSSFLSQNVVKTVLDIQGKVLYFSRQPIPHTRQDEFKQAHKQMGIYLFRRFSLKMFSEWEQTPLELAEGIDMMRIIEHGFPIYTHLVKDIISVDTPEDLFAAEQLLREDSWYVEMSKSDGNRKGSL